MKKVIYICLALALFSPVLSFAATITLSHEGDAVGSPVKISMYLSTQGESLNAFDGTVLYDKDLWSFAELSHKNSVVGVWLTEPTDKKGSLIFSGLIPGGINVERALLTTLYFIGKKEGATSFTISGNGYLDDGKGTQLVLKDYEEKVIVKKESSGISVALPQDAEGPRDITIQVLQNDSMFDGNPFIVVHAKDDAGIASIERLVSAQALSSNTLQFGNLLWEKIDNPAPLSPAELSQYIYIRITDGKGNTSFRQVSYVPKVPEGNGNILFNILPYLGILIVITFAVLATLWRVRKKNVA
ncbi:MAG: hypothetical protein AAB587_00090 [Patescibacteria group bacterium]